MLSIPAPLSDAVDAFRAIVDRGGEIGEPHPAQINGLR